MGKILTGTNVFIPMPVVLVGTVIFRQDPVRGLSVPAEMEERYDWDSGRIRAALAGERPTPDVEGRATYDHFRKFTVETEESASPPADR